MISRFFDKLARFIVKRRLIFVILFGVLALAFAVCIPFVQVNYNDMKYLPDDSTVSQGLGVMNANFGANGNGSVMAQDISVHDAVELKTRLEAVSGVKSVMWLDDLLDAFIGDIVAEMNEKNPEITKAVCVQYMWDLIQALPENAGEMSVFDLAGYIADALGSRFDINFLNFLLALNDKSTEMGLGFDTLNQFQSQLSTFYADGSAMYQVVFEKDDYSAETQAAIREIRAIGDYIHMTGVSVMTYSSVQAMNREAFTGMAVAAVVILVILFATTTSFWEPVLYLLATGVGVVINMGSNILMGNISYMTHAISSVLQIALTMDYAIFLLDRFKQERRKGQEPEDAMIAAIRFSFSPVSASSLTTMVSFIALMFMSYRIGFDMGLVLMKGVIFSLFSVFFFLPALIVYTNKLIVKSEHKSLNFHFRHVSSFLLKTRKFLPIIIIAAIIPFAYFSQQNIFTYGSEGSISYEGSSYEVDKQVIEATFGKQNQLVVLVPKEYYDREFDFSMAIMERCVGGENGATDYVASVQSKSLVEFAGFQDMLPRSFMAQFDGNVYAELNGVTLSESDAYTRVILFMDVSEEGERTTAAIRQVQEIADEYFGEAVEAGGRPYYLLGLSSGVLEIKELVEHDYDVINWVTIALVAAVLIFTFRSALLPVILLGVIEGAIFVNMAIPALMQSPMVFIGYMIVSSILVGATIDYAILLTNHYMQNRRLMNKFDAMRHAVAESGRALVTSAGILTFAGFAIRFSSSLPATQVFGSAIGRGGLSAFVLVLFLLPQLLVLLDKPIRYSTWRGKKNMIDNKDAKPSADVTSDNTQ